MDKNNKIEPEQNVQNTFVIFEFLPLTVWRISGLPTATSYDFVSMKGLNRDVELKG